MGNSSSFNPKQINFATFSPQSLSVIQKNKKLKAYIQSKLKRKPKNQIIIQEGYQSKQFWQVFPQDLSLNDLQTLLQSLREVKFPNVYFYKLSYQYENIQLLELEYRQKHFNKQFNLLKSLCCPYFVNLIVLSVQHYGIRSLQRIQFLNAPQLMNLYLKYNPFINFKPFNKCRFKCLKYLDLRYNKTREILYLSFFNRCDLNQNIGCISLDDDYQIIKSIQKLRQSIDLNAIEKWNSKIVQNISIRQIDCHNNSHDLFRLQPNQSYEFKIRQKIKQKYQSIFFEITQEQSIQEKFN